MKVDAGDIVTLSFADFDCEKSHGLRQFKVIDVSEAYSLPQRYLGSHLKTTQ